MQQLTGDERQQQLHDDVADGGGWHTRRAAGVHQQYNGLLFLCLAPSTMQSSIAFTSIARGNVRLR
jgi:hypothetical protein